MCGIIGYTGPRPATPILLDSLRPPHCRGELDGGSREAAVRAALRRIEGAYALVIFNASEPQTLVAARLNAPLVLGLGHGETLVSSDITALIPYTKRMLLLGEGEVA